MSKTRFSPRETRFLEFFFSGYLMKNAAALAGYKGSTPQSLCNRGRAILTKFSANPKALFRLAGPRETRIAQLLVSMADNNKSEHQQLKALTILSKCLGG
jgi:hypothetical protein